MISIKLSPIKLIKNYKLNLKAQQLQQLIQL